MGSDFPDPNLRINDSISFVRVFSYLAISVFLNKPRKWLFGYSFELFIAFSKGAIMGIAYFSRRGNIVTLNGIAVLKKYRRKKIGYLLLSNIIEYCKRERIESLQLFVLKNNVGAICLYRLLGFTFLGISESNSSYFHMKKYFDTNNAFVFKQN